MSRSTRCWRAVSAAMLGWWLCAPALGMSCMTVVAPRLVFGEYDPKRPQAHDVQGSLSIQCTPMAPGEVLDLKASLAGVSGQALYARNALTGERLLVGLYRDPARVLPADAQALFAFRAPLAVTTTIVMPLYGRIPAGQDVAVGSYQADLTILLEF